ncbi:stress response protein NST1-like isoform X2 [Dendronephthya gigantea]|uniref:stress response protein NST1-like isoform X2 n=1 Tax=Dendronephthya gigantea TaxID=151771 RepID=UPI00106D88E9|nr:stress response protein NST1-like isoform X2 [Dendronephthya gigantea]
MATNWNTQLPPGWEARWSENERRYYFVDHATHQTTWYDPRLAPVARNASPAEQIPLQEFQPSQPSTSSTGHKKETSFKYSIETAADESEEDEEWRDTLLRSTLMQSDTKKHLLFHEKINMKEKFKREFKELDAAVVENTVEQNDYDEDISRATLESLKDAHEEGERRKREEEERKRREKEREEKRKAAERKREIEKWKKEMKKKKEADEKKGAAAKAEREAKMRAEREATIKAEREAKMRAEREAKMKAEREAKIKAEREAERKRSAAAMKKATPTASATRTPQETEIRAPPTWKPVYISPNRLQSVGPQASLRKGPDRRNLVHYATNASGPNRSLVSGPQMSNRKGPSSLEGKVSISKGPQSSLRQGPQSSLRQGPQCRLVHNQERSTLAGQLSPFVYAV